MGLYPEYFKSFHTERLRQFVKSVPHYINELRDINSTDGLIAFLQFKVPYVFKVPSFPPRITLELTNNCNFSCRHCFRTLINREIESLDYKLAEKIIDELSHYPNSILKIGGMGEPSLYKDCDRFMKLLRDHNIKNIFYTNGSLFDLFSNQEILDWKMQHLVVSIDGTDAQTYEYMRVGGNYNKLKNALQAFKEERNNIGFDKPKIEVRHVILPNEKSTEITEFKKYWLQYSDTVMFNYLVPKGPLKGSNFGKSRKCRDIRREMYIRSNSKILLCGSQEHIGITPEWLFDTRIKSIKEAWYHSRLKEIRSLHEKGVKFIPEFCKGCVQTS